MVDRALQHELPATVGIHRQGEDGFAACTGGQHVADHHIGQRIAVGCQALQVHGADVTGQPEATKPIGTEIDQGRQRAFRAGGRGGLPTFLIAVMRRAVAGAQCILVNQVGHPREELFLALVSATRPLRHVVFHIDDEAAAIEGTDRVAITIDGSQYAGEIDRQLEQFVVVAIRSRMVQLADQGEVEAAVTAHLQGEDGFATGRCGEHVTGHVVGQCNATGAEPLGLETGDSRRAARKAKATDTVGAEVDQCAQRTGTAAGDIGDGVSVGDAIGSFVFVDDGGNLSALAFGKDGAVIVHQHIQLHGRRNVAVQVEHAHAEALAYLVGSTGRVGITVIQGVVGQGVGPVAGGIHHENAVLALHHATIGDIDPVAVDVLDLDGGHAIGGADDQRAGSLFGIAAGIGPVGQAFLVDHGRTGHDGATGILVLDVDSRREVRSRVIGHDRFRIGEFRPGIQAFGREADHRVQSPADLTEQYETVPTTQAAGTTGAASATRSGARCGRFTFNGRVDTCLDRCLQLLDVGQVAIGGRGLLILGLILCGLAIRARQQLLVETQVAVAPEGEDLTIAEGYRNRATCTGHQLFTGIDTIAFD